jgi:hypothetical protein
VAGGAPARRAGPSPPPRRSAASWLAAAWPVSLGMGIGLALHRGAGRTAVPVRSAIASVTVGVAGLSAALVFAASLSHLLASPALYGVTWDAIASNAAANDVRPIVATVKHDRRVAAWTTCWTGAPLRTGDTAFEAIALLLPGGTPFVPAAVTGRLPRTGREITLGTKTLRDLHARIGTTIGVSLDNAPPRPVTIVGTTVFPSLSDKLGLGTSASLPRHPCPPWPPSGGGRKSAGGVARDLMLCPGGIGGPCRCGVGWLGWWEYHR